MAALRGGLRRQADHDRVDCLTARPGPDRATRRADWLEMQRRRPDVRPLCRVRRGIAWHPPLNRLAANLNFECLRQGRRNSRSRILVHARSRCSIYRLGTFIPLPGHRPGRPVRRVVPSTQSSGGILGQSPTCLPANAV